VAAATYSVTARFAGCVSASTSVTITSSATTWEKSFWEDLAGLMVPSLNDIVVFADNYNEDKDKWLFLFSFCGKNVTIKREER
jgi:hypothetical protein